MAPRFSRPRLIDMDDRQYRAHLAQIMMTKSNNRPMRPPRGRELFGGEAEAALRTWLSERIALSERRIIEYFEHRGRSAIKKYREIDAVSIDGQTIHVFEMKASQKASSIRRAAQQLRDSRTLLRMLFRKVEATILLVDTGIPKTAEDIALIMAEEDAPFEPPPTLDEVLAIVTDVQPLDELTPTEPNAIGLLRFSVEQIIAIAGEENLHLIWDEDDDAFDDLDELEADEADEAPNEEVDAATNEDSGDDDGGAFAEALRKAQEQQGKKRR